MDISDHDIFIKLQSYSSDGIRLLSKKYYRYIIKIAMSFDIHQSDCEEIADDVLLRVLSNIDNFVWKHKSSLKALIISITHNLCCDFIKNKSNEFKKINFTTCDDFNNHYNDEKSDIDIDFDDIAKQVQCIQNHEAIKVFQEMPEEDRICFMMRASNHKYPEISELLKINETNLRQRMSRIKKKLRAFVKET